MNYTNQLLKIALSELSGIGPRKTRRLLEFFPNINDLFTLSYREIYLQTGISIDRLMKMDRDNALIKANKILTDCEDLFIQPIFLSDPEYPRRLKQCEDAPLVLYRKGSVDYNTSKFIAIVGTRTPSEYGYSLCRSFIEGIHETGAVVISGLAYGIDITIHKLCLEYEIPTIAVLAHGLERIYPNYHKSIAEEMQVHGGGLLSEFPPNAVILRENFPMRNRIVAGMCDATVVVESKAKGGSLITADLANDYSRDVFAFPGSIHQEISRGCNDLIAEQKAMLLRGPDDFLTKMNWSKEGFTKKKQTSLFHTLTVEEQFLVELLNRNQSAHIDSIAIELKRSISEVNVLLFQLEMEGLVKNLPGNRYQLI